MAVFIYITPKVRDVKSVHLSPCQIDRYQSENCIVLCALLHLLIFTCCLLLKNMTSEDCEISVLNIWKRKLMLILWWKLLLQLTWLTTRIYCKKHQNSFSRIVGLSGDASFGIKSRTDILELLRKWWNLWSLTTLMKILHKSYHINTTSKELMQIYCF